MKIHDLPECFLAESRVVHQRFHATTDFDHTAETIKMDLCLRRLVANGGQDAERNDTGNVGV